MPRISWRPLVTILSISRTVRRITSALHLARWGSKNAPAMLRFARVDGKFPVVASGIAQPGSLDAGLARGTVH